MRYLVLVATLILSGVVFSQKTYQRSFGETGDEIIYAVCETFPDSGLAFVGTTDGFTDDKNKNIYMLKTDRSGQLEWSYVYGGTDSDVARDMKPTSDGGFIVVGNSTSWGAGEKDVYLLKLDKKGDVEWSYTYGGEQYDYGFSVIQCLDGGYMVAGETSSFGRGSEGYLIKVDALGSLQWSKTYGGSGTDFAFDLAELEDGFVFGMQTNSHGAGKFDQAVVKVDKEGVIQWYRTYGGKSDDNGFDLLKTKDGGFVLTGSTLSYGKGREDFYLIKMDKKGDIEWGRTYGEEGFDQCQSVTETDEGYVMCGISNSFLGLEYGNDIYVVRINAKGIVKWSKTFGGDFEDYVLDISRCSDGDLILGGQSYSFNGRDDPDMYVVKFSDKLKSESCEHSNVVTIMIKQKFMTSKINENGLDAATVKGNCETVKLEVLTAENIICLDGNQIIQSRKRTDLK